MATQPVSVPPRPPRIRWSGASNSTLSSVRPGKHSRATWTLSSAQAGGNGSPSAGRIGSASETVGRPSTRSVCGAALGPTNCSWSWFTLRRLSFPRFSPLPWRIRRAAKRSGLFRRADTDVVVPVHVRALPFSDRPRVLDVHGVKGGKGERGERGHRRLIYLRCPLSLHRKWRVWDYIFGPEDPSQADDDG